MGGVIDDSMFGVYCKQFLISQNEIKLYLFS